MQGRWLNYFVAAIAAAARPHPLDEVLRLVHADVVGVRDEVRRADGLAAEAQVAGGDAARLVGVV